MLTHCMTSTRKAVELGQTMLSKGYLNHVCFDHDFEDDDYWYTFCDELIEKVKNNLDEKLNDKNYLKRESLRKRQGSKFSMFQHYRLAKHDEIIQYLVTMTISPETEIDVLLDVSKCFYLPTNLIMMIKMDMIINKRINRSR